MADLFHEDVPDAFIDRVLATIHRTPWHTYQLLTKRAERLPDFFANRPVPPNVWLGVTVEDRRHGLPRIEHLRRVSVRVRFLSVEPLLEDLGPLDLDGIDWVIVGGESGPDARPMREEWALSVRDQCWAGRECSPSSNGAPGDRTGCAATRKPTAGCWRAVVGGAAGTERGIAVGAGRDRRSPRRKNFNILLLYNILL
jgi:protein gp37